MANKSKFLVNGAAMLSLCLASVVSCLPSAASATAEAKVESGPEQINPADYPSLDDKELGHVRRIVNLSRQLPGDWSGMDDDSFSVAERFKEFQLGYMAVAIGLVQHSYTPAYRELYRKTMDSLIQKLTLPDVWEYWQLSSRVGVIGDPRENGLSPGWVDPVRKYNIFLKGYLAQSGAMYNMLYRDGKYMKDDAFVFRHVPDTWGSGPVTFRYSLPSIIENIHQEFVDSNYEGVLCEPNRMYPACNQPPILGLLNYDQVYGTKYAADVGPKFKEAWIRNGYSDPNTKQNIGFLMFGQKSPQPGSAVLDSWGGAWMNAWAPDLMKDLYPGQRKLYLSNYLSGDYARNAPPADSMEGGKAFISLGFGLLSFMSAEVGDQEARAKLIAYADRNFGPVWKDGAYYYPRNDNYKPDALGNSKGVDTWTGNVLIALARLDKGGSIRRLYEQPWGPAQLNAPQITDVDDLTTNVSQAFYDFKKNALIITLKPGPVQADRTTFVVRNLDPLKSYAVVKDGRLLGKVSRGGDKAEGVVRRADGTLLIDTSLAGRHSFVIVPA